MEKLNIVNSFTNYVDQLRNTECSQKEKISCFQHIAECILSPAMVAHVNYATHCSRATNVLLMFCEDLDSTVRMSAEENLNRIFRGFERTRVSRILLDLYGEIKRNGNERSLRICLNLFAYYAPQVKERNIKWYATHLAACLQVICQRKETMLCESLCEFVKSFGKYLQMGLTDSESCKLVELFITDIRSECAVKRRCSAQNCISLIENSRNKSLMAKHGLHKVIEILLHDQRSHAILGALGLLRILLPLIIRGFPDDCSNDESDNPPGKNSSISLETADDGATAAATSLMMKNECKQIIEIFDYCLHLLSTSHTSNHSIINASLEVINAILQAVEPGGSCSSLSNDNDFPTAQCLQQLLSNQQLQHNEYLRRRKSLKNQIFHSKNYEMTSAAAEATGEAAIEASNSTTRPPTLVSTATPTPKRPQLITAKEAEAGASQSATVAVAEMRRDDSNDDDEKELNKHKTSVGSAARKDERLFVALPDQNSACELGMQKVGDAKTVQQEVGIPKPTTTTTTTSTITTRAVIPTTIQGVHVDDDKRKNVTDDVDKHHNDDEESKSPQKYPSKVGCTEQKLEAFKIIPGHSESKESGSKDDLEDGVDRVNTSKKFVEFDNEVAVENEIDDDDDFTKLSEINEPHSFKAFAAVTAEPALTSTIDVVNLIDAIDATTESKHKTTSELVEQQQQLCTSDTSTVSASAIDQKPSQHMSDIDNESFKSIDFEAEIKIAGMSDESAASRADVAAGGAVVGGPSNEATFGSFFNNLLTHPSTESMTKLFRSSAVKSSPIKTPGTSGSGAAAVELDGISINSSVAVSISATDTFSLDSMSSLSQTHEESAEKQSARKYSGSLNDETPSTTASVTASTAVLMDTNTRNTTAEVSTDEDEVQREPQPHQQQQQQRQQQTPPQFEMRKRPSFNRIPNVNPFLKDSPLKQTAVELPQLQVQIGSIYEQPLIFYAGRLVAARFLLTGQPGELQSDGTTRVSIKNLSLCVVAQCVRLVPQLLSHSLEISAFELQRLEPGVEMQHPSGSPTVRLRTPPTSTSSHSSSTSGSPTKPPSDSSSNLGKDYEHLDAGGEVLDFARSVKRSFASPFLSDLGSPKSLPKPDQSLPLNIKDDHFGVSTTDFFLTGQPLSRSIDSATFVAAAPLLGEKISIPKQKQKQQHMLLSKSEIIEKTFGRVVHQSVEDAVPSSPPPRPPKRMKSLRKQRIDTTSADKASDSSVPGAAAAVVDGVRKVRGRKVKPHQQLSDVVLFFKHPDPVLRGGVQHIIGNFIQASKATLRVDRHLQLNHLVAILVEGLQDEIHTVVIQALNAFDKAFPLVLAKYLAGTRGRCCSSSCSSGGTGSCCCHYQQQQHEQSKQTSTRAPFVEQRQYICRSCSKMCFQKNPNDAFTRKLYSSAAYSSSSAATTTTAGAGTDRFLDNDELIASILNGIQSKTKNDNQNEKGEEAMATAVYLNDIYDNNDPHVDDGLYNEQYIDNAAPAEALEGGANITGRSIQGVALEAPALCISPKLLLNKLRLCYQHKYWLVQNKYAEVISNLNYVALREYYVEDSDLVTTYEQIFLDQLLQLIGEDDFRVREHAAECLSRFIIENAKCHHYKHQQEQQHKPQTINDLDIKASKFSSCSSAASAYSTETFQTNFNLLWDFLDYRIFSGMSMPLRNLFTANSAIAPPLTKPTSSLLSTSTSTSSTFPSTASSSSTSTASVRNMDCNRYAAFTVQRQIEQEQKLLAKVLYRLTNKLMKLSDKNAQFGIIYTLKVLLKHFNFLDYHSVWTEFNFIEICMRYSYYNHATAVDLNCQNDLIDVTGKLMAGSILTSSHVPEQQQKHHQLIDTLLTHIMKITNIYHHIFSNQKPLLFGKTHKTDLFSSAKEVAIVQSWGYFGNDYVYLKLYSILKSANDSYKMTINQASGSILMSLLRTCINTLSLCIEMRSHGVGVTSNNNSNFMTLPQETCGASPSVPASALKLIEEILQYLTKLINYAAVESIACLRQLLKYLFARNYGNHQHDYATMTTTTPTTTMRTTFIQQFCRARTWPQQRQQHLQLPQSQQQQRQPGGFDHTVVASEMTTAPSAIVTCATNSRQATRRSTNNNSYNPPMHWEPQDWSVFGELIASVSRFCDECQSGRENAECATYIKIFEPLVINCLPLFLKSNALVQASILELLSQLLELNVTYSILDSKNMMFNQIINNLDLIESGIARNGHVIIPPTMRFLIQLTTKSDCKLITIPKIISIANNLLANNGIRQCAVLALKSLAYEIFFIDTEAQNAIGGAALTQLEDQRATFQSPISSSPMATPEQLRRHQVSAQEAAAAAEMLLHNSRELDTQKEVVLGMLEKFIDANECQHVLGLFLLRERSVVEASTVTMTTNTSGQQHQQIHPEDRRHQVLLQDPGAVFGIVCRALCERRIRLNEWSGFFVLDALFKNCGKLVLADSKIFLSLLQLLFTKDVANFSNLSCATIILDNVILKTEEIYLVNHVKLYLKNHGIQRESRQHILARLPDGPSTSMAAASALNSTLTSSGNNYNSNKGCSTGISNGSGHDNGNGISISINEIKFFAKVLYEQLDECFAKLTEHLGSSSNHLHNNSKSNNNNNNNNCSPDRKYCGLVVRFIKALHNVCCCSRLQDALQSVFRLVLDESNFRDKYLRIVTEGIDVAGHHLDEDASSLQLQLELVRLLSSLRLLDIFFVLQQLQAPAVKWSVRRTILLEICERNANQLECSPHQVEQLFHPAFLNILIADAFSFVCRICEVDEEFCSLWLRALIDNYAVLYKHSIRILARFAPRFCTHNNSINCIAKFLHLLAKLHHHHHHHRRRIDSERALEQLIESTARCLLSFAPILDKNAIYDSFMRMNESEHREKRTGSPLNGGRLHYILLNELENLNTKANHLQFEQKIIDEKWLFAQLNKCSAQSDYDPEKLTRILLDVQSEHKLHKIFTTADFDTERLLAPAITCSLRAMLSSFRTNCIQHNPHIHYMQPNPLARVACAVLMSRIGELTAPSAAASTETIAPSGAEGAFLWHSKLLHLAAAVMSLMEAVKQIQATALIYIEARLVEKFLQEQLLRHDNVAMLMRFLRHCCAVAKQSLILAAQTAVRCDGDGGPLPLTWSGTCSILRCIDELLKQQLIWKELNQLDGRGFSTFSTASPLHSTHSATATTAPILSQKQRNKLLCNLLEVLSLAATKSIQTTLFYKQYKPIGGWRPCVVAAGTPIDGATVHVQHANNVCLLDADDNIDDDEDDESVAEAVLADFFPAAIFVAKLIETQIDIIAASGALSSSHITGRAAAGVAGVTAHCAAAGVAPGRTGGAVGIAGAAGGGALHVDDYFVSSETEGAQVTLLNLLQSIGISILRTNQFYAYAMTPLEIVQQQQQLPAVSSASSGSKERASPGRGTEAAVAAIALETPTKRSKTTGTTTRTGKLPTIPVDSLSDMDILRKFIKRLSIFGFTTRQQFEEHFMTFLLLINKVYDENMVDQQEQFQIKSTCLEAILELLITYKTFPIVGDKLSCFHHTPRWSRINCDGISLKKLHRVQILISESNIFYHPNLERHLSDSSINNYSAPDNVIGTKCFLTNQMDLSFVWQQMEAFTESPNNADDSNDNGRDAASLSASEGGGGGNNNNKSLPKERTMKVNSQDVGIKNYYYFTKRSGIDFKSSSQLIFDVMMQIIEYNHILVLPNLVKFCEICESRDQIKWIKDKAVKMQESIPVDDTISHQHIIYLLCKTQAMLIPTLSELQQLCTLIANYLRSSHVFIRNATLAGLLSLLECCTKTNTSMGKLSEELSLLRELSIKYINRHGVIDKSSIQGSGLHAKLVWTLNFALIEWTSKYVPQCHLLSNTIIATSPFLRKTPDVDVYLCVLHGLERMVVISTLPGNNSIVPQELRHKIEKLALDLVKLENEKFSIPGLKLLLSCMYVGSAKQLENTELSNGIVQDDPEIIAQQTDKVDVLLHCIKSSSRNAARIYGQVLCQIIRDLVPPNEILTKVIKEFLAINQPHCDVIAMIVYQVFRSAIDSSFLQMLQDWLICSLPTFLALSEQKAVWALSVIFLSASINVHLIKLFPVLLGAREFRKLGQHEIALFVTAAQDFHARLSAEQSTRFREAFQKLQDNQIIAKMLQSL